MDIPRHHCFVCGYEWPMIVADPKKCPHCQSKHWRAKDVIDAMSDRVLAEMVEYGKRMGHSCVLSPNWAEYGDLRGDIAASMADGNDWARLIHDFLNDP